jgi:hypothetical protein
MRRLSLVLPLLLAACGSSTGPTQQPSLEFESEILFGIPTLATTAVGSEGMIQVTGVIHTIGTGFTLTGTVTVTGPNALTLEIDAYDNKPGVYFPVQNFYRAELRLLAPGDYDLSVNHNIHSPAPGLRERVYHQTVHVN